MIEEVLKQGFTLYCKYKNENICGGYLKKTDKGLYPMELIGSEKLLIEKYPEILKKLIEGYTLQIYGGYSDYKFTAIIGKGGSEGPYGENEILFDIMTSYGYGLLDALNNINNELTTKKEEKQYTKAYRLYGQDKYHLE